LTSSFEPITALLDPYFGFGIIDDADTFGKAF